MEEANETTENVKVETQEELLAKRQVEEFVNQAAQATYTRMKLPPCRFKIFLHNSSVKHFKLERGTTVFVHIFGYDIREPEFALLLKDVLKKIHKLQEPYQLEVRNVIFERQAEARKFLKIKYERIEEVLPLVHEEHIRFSTDVTVSIKARDAVTGIEVEFIAKNPKQAMFHFVNDIQELKKAAWIQLSREVAEYNKKLEQEELNEESNDQPTV